MFEYLDKILDSLHIKYYKKETKKNQNVYLYLCVYNMEEDIKLPFRIAFNTQNKLMGLFSEGIVDVPVEKRTVILEIINKRNSANAFGVLYIDNNNKVKYYNGISLEGEIEHFSKEQLLDYINNMMYSIDELLDELTDLKIINDSSDEIAVAGEKVEEL